MSTPSAALTIPLRTCWSTIGADTKALFGDEIWDAMTIDGHIYGIPSLKDSGYFISLIYNATMAEELGIEHGELHLAPTCAVLKSWVWKLRKSATPLIPSWAESPRILGQ